MPDADRVLSQSSFEHVIDVPADRVDIADWLFHLGNKEYERCCPPDHIACGYTHTDDGRLMSINVETIGASLVIQQYGAEVHKADYCKMVSTSDVFPFSGGRTQPGSSGSYACNRSTSPAAATATPLRHTRLTGSWSSSPSAARPSTMPPPRIEV